MSGKVKSETVRRQEELLDWLFAFQALDAKDIDIREAQRQLKELVVVQFCEAGKVQLAEWLEWMASDPKGRTRASRARFNEGDAFRKQVKQPTKAAVLEIHQWLRRFINQGRPSVVKWAIEPSPTIVDSSLRTEMRGIPYVDHRKLPYKVTPYQPTGKFSPLPTVEKKDRHYAAIVSVLDEYDATIAICDANGCAMPFLRVGRQRYCSKACTQAVQSAAWYRRKKPEILERKKQKYEEKVWREKNPRVQVRRNKSR